MAFSAKNQSRLAVLAPEARRDLLRIYDDTEDEWGTEQADSYTSFLLDAAQMLAENPRLVPLVPNFPAVRSYFARWKNARQGHRIFFQENDSGINVIRILYSRVNWPDHLTVE